MATHKITPVLGKRIRVTQLDSCGNPPAAGVAGSTVVTDGFITLTLTSEVEEGAEIITKKADGSLCVNQKLADSFKRFTLEMEFCGVHPDLLAMVTNAEIYQDWADDNAGFTVPEGTIDTNFALELWTGLSGSGCAPGVAFAGGYLLLPFLKSGVLGDITVDGENAITFSVMGAYTQGGNTWGTGPFNVILNESGSASPLPTALDPLDHLLLMDTGLAPPPSSVDPLPIPPYISSITPASGPAAGGTAVVILGSGLTGSTAVSFGGTPGTSFSLVNDGRINVTTAAHAAGANLPVVITRAGGNITKTGAFTYT